MAKSSDELERELELKRQQLHSRVGKLRERVAGDVRGMRDQTQEELTTYLHKAESQVSEHPWLSLAGGFGGGLALGMTTGGSGSHKASSNGQGASPEYGGAQSESLLARGVNALVSATGGPVFDEVRGTLQETLSEMKSTLKESMNDVVHGITGTSNGHTPNGNPAEHRQRVRDHAAA